MIKRIVSKEHKEWIVVTSDRDIVNHAWSADSIPVSSDLFLDRAARHAELAAELSEGGPADKKDRQISPTPLERDSKDDLQDRSPRRGNPYRLSKKEKALRRALHKL